MSTVQRWLSALGDSAIEDYPPLAVLAGWIAVLTGQTAEARTLGGDRRRRLVRPGAAGWLGVVRLGAGDVAGRDVSRRPAADAGRRELRGRPGAAVEPVARHGAVPVRRGASARRRRRPGGCAVRGVLHPGGRDVATPITSSTASRELALLAMDRGRWAEAAEHVQRALAAIDEHRMHDYADQPARLRRRGPARPAPRRLDRGGPPARAGDAGPSDLHVRAALPRRARTAATGQGLPRHRRRDRPPVIC